MQGLGSGFDGMNIHGFDPSRRDSSVSPTPPSLAPPSPSQIISNFCAVVIAGRPVLHEWTQVGDKLMLDVLEPSTVNELSFFMLPGAHLPPGHGAAIYYAMPPHTHWSLLGAVHENAPSGVFRTGWRGRFANQTQTLRLGVSVEPIETIQNLQQVKGWR